MHVLSSTGHRRKMSQCSRQTHSFLYAIPLFEIQNLLDSSKSCVMKITINKQNLLHCLPLSALAGEKLAGVLVFSGGKKASNKPPNQHCLDSQR